MFFFILSFVQLSASYKFVAGARNILITDVTSKLSQSPLIGYTLV